MFRAEHHINLRHLMQSLNYSADKGGICLGTTMMAIQACATNDIDAFNERMAFISSNENLVNDIVNVKNKIANTKLPAQLTLSDFEKKIIDVITFCDGIELYQNPNNHTDLFNQTLTQLNTVTISKFASSTELEQLGGLIKPMSWAGIYNATGLMEYFQLLDKIATSSNNHLHFNCHQTSMRLLYIMILNYLDGIQLMPIDFP